MVSEPNRFPKGGHDGIDYMPRTSRRSQPNMDNPTQAPSQPILLNSTLSLPPSVSKTISSKIENLIEYSYVPEDAQISETHSPLLSPYNIFRRQRSALRSITRLISSKRPHVKEYVQSSIMDQCSLAATSEEQYVKIEIPKDLIRHWQTERYTPPLWSHQTSSLSSWKKRTPCFS